jgi:hypothetical protein
MRLWFHRDFDHGGSEQFPFEIIASLELGENRLVLVFLTMNAFHCLMEIRIEDLSRRFERLQAHPGQSVGEPLIDEFHAFGVVLVGRFDLDGPFEVVEHGQKAPDQIHCGELHEIGALLLEAFASVIEIGVTAPEAVLQIGLLDQQLIALGGYSRKLTFERGRRQLFLVGNLIGFFGVHCS